jgi:hypothetical protein
MIAGTKAETVIAIIEKIPLKIRNVSEITLDMAANMGLIAKKCFPMSRVIDSMQKISIRGFTRNQNNPLASSLIRK